MRRASRLLVALVVTMGVMSGTASAQFSDRQDEALRVIKEFDDPFAATHSDFAFWGKYAVLGYYTAATGGVHIYDISDPANPDEIRNFPCNGNQNDPILWDRNRNGVPDLMLLAVDRTMDSEACDAAQSMQPNPTPGGPPVRFDANPQGWEGVRIFDVSDGSNRFPGAPFANIEQVHNQYTDCGAHTITANTRFANDPAESAPRRVRVVVSAAAGADVRSDRLGCRRDRSRTRTPTTSSRTRATARSRTRFTG